MSCVIPLVPLVFAASLAYSQPASSLLKSGAAENWVEIQSGFHGDWPQLSARINGKGPFHVILDSGCPYTVMSEETVTQAGFEVHDQASTRFVRDIRLEVANISCSLRGGVIQDLDPISRAAGIKIDALVGADFFEHRVVRIDYAEEKVFVLDAKAFEYTENGFVVPIDVHEQYMVVHATTEVANSQTVGFSAVIDTGGHLGVNFSEEYADFIGIPLPGQPRQTEQVVGIDGLAFSQFTRVPRIRLGTIVLDAPAVGIFGHAGRSFPHQALIGTQFLRRFRCTFDIPRRRLILEPNEEFGVQLSSNATTLGIGCQKKPDSDDFAVKGVAKFSPAEGKIQVNDIVLSVGDISIEPSNLTISRAKQAVRMSLGKPLPIRIRRDGVELQVELTPKDKLDWPDHEPLPESDELPPLPNDNYWKVAW